MDSIINIFGLFKLIVEGDEDFSLNIKITNEDKVKLKNKGKVDIKNMNFDESVKEKLINDLKTVTLKSWFQKAVDEVFRNYNLITIDIEQKLFEACEKMKKEHLHRIIITNKESNLVVGTLTHRDILLFIIRNFKGTSDNWFKMPIKNIGKIGYLEDPVIIIKNETVFASFQLMLEKNLSSLPVINESGKFLGLLKYENEQFLNYLKEEKKCYRATSYEGTQYYTPNDSLQVLVEKLLFAPGNRLIYLDEETQKIKGIITLTDLFLFYLENF